MWKNSIMKPLNKYSELRSNWMATTKKKSRAKTQKKN